LHVDIKYAATVHAFWPRELKDWDEPVRHQKQVRKKYNVGTYPFPRQAAIWGNNLGSRKSREEQQGQGREHGEEVPH
jgi:hypothetical protein